MREREGERERPVERGRARETESETANTIMAHYYFSTTNNTMP